MSFIKKNRVSLWTLGIILVAGVVALWFAPLIVVANVWFMIGLLFLIGAAFFILEKAHLFAGWFHFRKKGEEDLKKEKIKVESVGSLKNGPIVVNRYARFCLIVGVTLIVVSIFLTLI
ncbi:hypothetical protein LOSG293_050420 [Secundilactobacillus oryzae JCM 18671]|uniref:DUF3899 domain-containing protein n=1 Tax=Secundilactobacillus oryzae JCM 18671 TaxID=1291743 RepID=A0A081BH54_9LACO|nr:DUF3899 domain-containing protein [Secundilactobacillus oryzae]GAK47372.1 hypothetical protein LOSG293_050420 [Secundilactobacillus oryzae JCM 18671]